MPEFEVVESEVVNDWIGELVKSGESKGANDVFKLFQVYKYVKKHEDKAGVMEDKRWDKLNVGRNIRPCKTILEAYEGDLKKAAKAVYEIGTYIEKDGFYRTWNMNTVLNLLTDFEEKRLIR